MRPETLRGLEHIIGFAWLHKFMAWPAAIRLPFLSVVILTLVFVPWLLGAGIVDSMTLLVTMIMTGSVVAVMVILASGAQIDLTSSGGGQYLDDLAASGKDRSIETVIGVLLGFCITSYFSALFDDDGLFWLWILDPSYYEPGSAGSILNQWFQVFGLVLSGLLITYGFAFSLRQIRTFSTWAAAVNIDLIHTDELQVFSMQPLRYLLITVLFASLNIIVYQVLSVLDLADQAFAGQVPLVLVMCLCCIPFLRPASIIRRRIADAKTSELGLVREALRGNRAALAASQISRDADEFKAPDLMAYEQQIKSIWEWPIQGYVQRVLLYVLLPPLAWVLAALVEQLVDAFLS